MRESGRAGTPASGSPPATMRAAVRAEWRRALHPPYETPGVVVGNGLLLAVCWTLLPASAVSSVFRFHGPLAFSMVLASWMYSDVPATNLLGGDPQRSIAALPDPVVLRRMWYAKNLIMWMLVTPVCALTAIGIGIYENQLVTTLLTLLWIAAVPLGALGFPAGWVCGFRTTCCRCGTGGRGDAAGGACSRAGWPWSLRPMPWCRC